jgi:hypothetical protein
MNIPKSIKAQFAEWGRVGGLKGAQDPAQVAARCAKARAARLRKMRADAKDPVKIAEKAAREAARKEARRRYRQAWYLARKAAQK